MDRGQRGRDVRFVMSPHRPVRVRELNMGGATRHQGDPIACWRMNYDKTAISQHTFVLHFDRQKTRHDNDRP